MTNMGVGVRPRLSGLLRKAARGRNRSPGNGPGAEGTRETAGDAATGAPATRIHAELAEELPDEDLGEDLADFLEHYEPGSRPGMDEDEEAELLETVRGALDRIERGR
ncbi:hypothetical protein ACH4GP_10050 [Streptomyces celluloflavus]|uniref:Uncharacterized protein n=1 Tax=Streptomyces celluloflavus TaxID=58344 RepID=A0ABW7R9H5_9ACTN